MNRNRNLAQLAVVAASHKKNVGALTQSIPFLNFDFPNRLLLDLSKLNVQPFRHPKRVSLVGQGRNAFPKPGTRERLKPVLLQSKADAALSSAKGIRDARDTVTKQLLPCQRAKRLSLVTNAG